MLKNTLLNKTVYTSDEVDDLISGLDIAGITASIASLGTTKANADAVYTITETDTAIATAVNQAISGTDGLADIIKDIQDALDDLTGIENPETQQPYTVGDLLVQAIQNKVDKLETPTIAGTYTSVTVNASGLVTSGSQIELKTINGESLIGSDDIEIIGKVYPSISDSSVVGKTILTANTEQGVGTSARVNLGPETNAPVVASLKNEGGAFIAAPKIYLYKGTADSFLSLSAPELAKYEFSESYGWEVVTPVPAP